MWIQLIVTQVKHSQRSECPIGFPDTRHPTQEEKGAECDYGAPQQSDI